MSLHLIKDFDTLMLTKNPDELTFIKRGIYHTAGSYADHYFEMEVTIIVGLKWVIEWGNGSKSHTITLVANANNDPNEIPANVGFLSVPVYLDTVFVPALNRITQLTEDFIIEHVGYNGSARNYVRFRARKKGSYYNITSGAATDIVFYTNEITPGVDPATYNDYKLKLLLSVEQDPGLANYQDLITLEATGLPNEVNNEMAVTFYEVPRLMSKYYKVAPPSDPYRVQLKEKLLRRFRYFVREFFDSTDQKISVESGEHYIYHAGIAFEKADYYEHFKAFLNAGFRVNWLTNQPREKVIGRNQPEWLCAYADSSYAIVKTVRTTAYFDNGTNEVDELTWENDWYDTPVIIPAGIKQLRLTQYESGRTLTHYTVQLTGNMVFEVMTYLIDPQAHWDERFLVFENSFGGLDTMRCLGKQQHTLEMKTQTAEGVMTSETRMEQGLQMVSAKFDQDKWKMNTGPVDEEDLVWINDFLRSRHVWEPEEIPDYNEVIHNSYKMRFRKMVLSGKKHKMNESDAMVWDIDFEAQYAWDDQSITDVTLNKERVTDDYYEFTVWNGTDDDETLYLNMNVDVENVSYYFDGEFQWVTGYSLNIPVLSRQHLRIKVTARNLKRIELSDGNFGQLKIAVHHLPLYNLEYLQIAAGDFNAAYFVNVLRHARKIYEIELAYTGTDADTDALLRELNLARLTYGELLTVRVLGTAPSPAGEIDKAEMVAGGVSVTTS